MDVWRWIEVAVEVAWVLVASSCIWFNYCITNMLSNQETFLVCGHMCVGVCVKRRWRKRDREGMCVLADRRVWALVFEKGFPVSGIGCGFLGTPHMETPLSQPTIGINSPLALFLSLSSFLKTNLFHYHFSWARSHAPASLPYNLFPCICIYHHL